MKSITAKEFSGLIKYLYRYIKTSGMVPIFCNNTIPLGLAIYMASRYYSLWLYLQQGGEGFTNSPKLVIPLVIVLLYSLWGLYSALRWLRLDNLHHQLQADSLGKAIYSEPLVKALQKISLYPADYDEENFYNSLLGVALRMEGMMEESNLDISKCAELLKISVEGFIALDKKFAAWPKELRKAVRHLPIERKLFYRLAYFFCYGE